MINTCQCPLAGYCERYKRRMNGRLYLICRGQSGLPVEQEAKYRDNWRKLSKSTIRSPKPKINQQPLTPCRHLGPEVRREQCKACGGKVMVKVVACAIHLETQGQSKKIKGVASCRDCPDYQGASE